MNDQWGTGSSVPSGFGPPPATFTAPPAGPAPAAAPAAPALPPLTPDDPGTIAGYTLRARLGSGGMGKVYLAYTPGGRPVAIKVIRPEFAEDPEFRRRFRHEVQAAQRVQGLYTAAVVDCDTEGPTPWLATAYVPGPSLHAAVSAHGPRPVPVVLHLVAAIAEALQAIHGAGIVHRDLKPSNVLLAADGPRVIDFGIARAADATSLTGTGNSVGTPAFMAPEQATGAQATAATDVFALGHIAVYAATGKPAFGEGASSAVLYRIVHEEPDLSGVPEPVRELALRCLARDPAARPTPAQVVEACRELSGGAVQPDWAPQPPPAAPHAPERGPGRPPAQTPAPAFPPPSPPLVPVAYEPTVRNGSPVPPVFPGHPDGTRPGQTTPAPGKGPRRPSCSVVVTFSVVMMALAGGAGAYLANGGGPGGTAASGRPPTASAATPTGAANPPSPGSSAPADPKPRTYQGVDVSTNYGLSLADDPPKAKESSGEVDLFYNNTTGLDGGTTGKVAVLDGARPGTLAACRADTRFANYVDVKTLSNGSRLCVTGGDGSIALVTVRGHSPDNSPSTYLTFDLTVWRGAARSS